MTVYNVIFGKLYNFEVVNISRKYTKYGLNISRNSVI